MAVIALSAIAAAFNLIYMDDLADTIRRDSVLLNLLGVAQDRNEMCSWVVKATGRSTAKWSSGADVVSGDFSNHERRKAYLPWARGEAFAGVDGLAAALASANGPGQVGRTINTSVLREEIGDAVDELALKFSAACYTGNPSASPAELSGVDTMVVGNTYAGIDKTALTTPADWESSVVTILKSALDEDTLRENLIRPFKNATGRNPEFITCDGEIYDIIGTFLGTNRRTTDTVTTAAAGVVNLKLRGGFNALEFDGIPIIEDRHATANTIYAWDSRMSSFRQVPAIQDAMVAPEAISAGVAALTGSGLPPEMVSQVMASRIADSRTRLQPSVHHLAKLGDSERLMVKCYVQLRHKSRKHHAQLKLTP